MTQNLCPYTDAGPANCPEVSGNPNSALCAETALTPVGERLHVTPSRIYVNASTPSGSLSLTGWTVARPGADDHKAFKSRGF